MGHLRFYVVKDSDPEQFVIVEDRTQDPTPADPPMDMRGPYTEVEFRTVLRAGGVPDSYIDALIIVARENPMSLG